MRRARVHHRVGLEGLRQAPARSAASSCPTACVESQQLPEPIFTPATKADVGDHDENVDFDRAAEIIGDRPLLEELRRLSIELYKFAADHARERGVILADTKFEFGRNAAGEIVVGDEVLTPDSSRYWPADDYEPGRGQASFDKQFVRDWATQSGWDKSPPAPAVPDDVVEGTRARYEEAYQRITGEPLVELARALRGVVLMSRARVLIRPKEGILDPQGQAVERALPALGFKGASHVHIGRLVELDVEDPSELEAMCEKLLANPLIEDYEIQEIS